jgi:mRNA interferase MazF
MVKLDPTQGSEQAGVRPVVIVSRESINQNSPVVLAVPVTDATNKKRVYPSQVFLPAGSGGLSLDSIALGEQVRSITKQRLIKYLGQLSRPQMKSIETALKIALDLT